jgi:two-component system response regulator MtrA
MGGDLVTTQNINILVIDDDESVLESILIVLGVSGYQATGALSGEEGLTTFQKGSYDLVLTDLMMPGMSGLDIAKAIKGIDASVPVIIVSGSADELAPEKLWESSVAHILAKPFKPAELRRVINEALKRENVQL